MTQSSWALGGSLSLAASCFFFVVLIVLKSIQHLYHTLDIENIKHLRTHRDTKAATSDFDNQTEIW